MNTARHIESTPHPDLYDRLINIPCSVSLKEAEISEVVEAMKEVLTHQSAQRISI